MLLTFEMSIDPQKVPASSLNHVNGFSRMEMQALRHLMAQSHVTQSTVATPHDSGFSTGRTQISSDYIDGFSPMEMQALRRVIAQADSPYVASSTSATLPAPSSGFAHTGNPISAYTASSHIPWIIDSGATNHMTSCSSLFDTYSTCSGKDKVRVADGSLSTISGKGSIQCSPSLSLSSVLHIPTFDTNLLSVSSLTRSANCSVTFFPTHCVFQELETGKVIGSGKAHGGLYFLEPAFHSSHPPVSCGLALQADTSSAMSMLHQWHRRLGHPSFGILEKLFPNLTKYCPRNHFFCEACELGKHKRSVYAPINKRSDVPFMVIHSDVWGPSPIASLKDIGGLSLLSTVVPVLLGCTC